MAVVFACYAANHFRTLLGLKVEVETYARHNKEFKHENIQLTQSVDELEKAGEQLQGAKADLQRTTRKYQENITKLDAVQKKLAKFSSDNMEGMKQIQV